MKCCKGGTRLKVVLISLNMFSNLGEHFVIDCTEYLLQKAAPGEAFEFTVCDLYGRVQRTSKLYTPSKNPAFACSKDPSPIENLVRRAVQKGKRNASSAPIRDYLARLEWLLDPNYAPRMHAYFRPIIQAADLIMFAGGGIIEYSYNRYQDSIEAIVQEARRAGKPVVFSAVGLVGECDPKSLRFQTMRRALTSPNVRLITVRDHVDLMNERYLKGAKIARIVADSAVWAAEAFGISASPRPVIGVGLVREDAFQSYDRPIPYANLIDMYRDVVAELEARGYEWQLFGNGFENDQEFGEKLIGALGASPARLVPRPTECSELIKTIAGFQGIITFRLHSCIAAYSLGIPAVVFSWNDKVDDFMQIIGFPDRALSGDRATARTAVDQMERAIKEPYDESQRAAYRETIADAVRDAYLIARER